MDDFDVEALLEAPYNKNKSSDEEESYAKDERYSNGSNEKGGHKHRRRSRDDDDVDYSKRRADDDDSPPRERSNKNRRREGSHTDIDSERKRRSRSRSASRDDRRGRDRDREKRRSRSRDSRRRSRERRSRERRSRERKSRERKSRERRSRERKSRERKSRERKSRERRSRERRSRERRDEVERRHEPTRERREKSRTSERQAREYTSQRDEGERRHDPTKERREKARTREERSRSRDSHRRSRERSREQRAKSGKRSRSRDKTSHRRSFSPRPFRRARTPPNGLGERSPLTDMSPEERDARTVFCMQLSQRVRARDLEEFFSSVGKVRDVRLITCNKTKRFKGIAYIEFRDPESVALALGLSGQRLLGIPISVQHTQAEKNRMSTVPAFVPKKHTGPMRLYVGSLHFNITEDMLRGIFEPFGKIDSIQLIMDSDTGRSKGYGFITYHNADDAKKALEQLNGFELAGRPMKVGNVTERLDMNTASLDTDEMDRSGIDLGATGRLQLMFKLAEGAGLAVPQAAANALLATAPQPPPAAHTQTQTPPIATQCFMLSNMFDPRTETNPAWDVEIRDDVIEECSKHGGVLHIHVDKASLTGNVYVKCPSITTAVLAVNALHGRWFAGRVIAAAYVPLLNYHSLFPDAITAVNLLATTRKPSDD